MPFTPHLCDACARRLQRWWRQRRAGLDALLRPCFLVEPLDAAGLDTLRAFTSSRPWATLHRHPKWTPDNSYRWLHVVTLGTATGWLVYYNRDMTVGEFVRTLLLDRAGARKDGPAYPYNLVYVWTDLAHDQDGGGPLAYTEWLPASATTVLLARHEATVHGLEAGRYEVDG